MKTFVNLCKKPLLIVSAVLFVVFTALLVVSFTMPLGKTYAYKNTIEEEGIKFEVMMYVSFDTDKEYSTKAKVLNVADIKAQAKKLGEDVSDKEIEEYIKTMEKTLTTEKNGYVVENGKIYSVVNIPQVGEQKIEIGEKKGTKLVSPMKDADGNQVAYVCTANSAIQIASIILMVVSGIALAGCVVVMLLDKKGIFDNKNSEAVAE